MITPRLLTLDPALPNPGFVTVNEKILVFRGGAFMCLEMKLIGLFEDPFTSDISSAPVTSTFMFLQ